MNWKSSYWKFVAAFTAIVIVVAGGYFIWDRYFSEAGFIRRQAAVAEKAEKEYIADVYFGAESATDDAEGEKTLIAHDTQPTELEIQKILPQFTGEIMQMPPQYSALKIGGRAAYKFARKGRVAPLAERRVLVKEIELLEYKWPHLKLRVVTGPGVYIRALARDIGRALKVGGYLSDLERTRVGDFTKEDCQRIY